MEKVGKIIKFWAFSWAGFSVMASVSILDIT